MSKGHEPTKAPPRVGNERNTNANTRATEKKTVKAESQAKVKKTTTATATTTMKKKKEKKKKRVEEKRNEGREKRGEKVNDHSELWRDGLQPSSGTGIGTGHWWGLAQPKKPKPTKGSPRTPDRP